MYSYHLLFRGFILFSLFIKFPPAGKRTDLSANIGGKTVDGIALTLKMVIYEQKTHIFQPHKPLC